MKSYSILSSYFQLKSGSKDTECHISQDKGGGYKSMNLDFK